MVIVGIDEVGRGCWAGPLVAGAVILGDPIDGVADSKKLTKLQRQNFAKLIKARALACGLGWVRPSEIDAIGLSKSVELAMRRALKAISVDFDRIIIDGNVNFLSDDLRAVTKIRADESVPEVSAASIIAKVARDSWMCTVATAQHPEYHFDKHVGYGTMLHLEMLQKFGVCDLHRQSFKPIQKVLEEQP